MTQKQLAQLLGVHYNTISSWELDTYLPATRGLVMELAHHLRLDGQETLQLLEASLTALSPRWNIPYQRNSFFTGRDDILHQIHTSLQGEQNTPLIRSCALSGLGGIGKTQTVVEYAYRYAQEYASIFWIGAETFESIASSFLGIAEMLLLPERLEADQQRMIGAVQHWLAAHNQWLLIWDNVEDLDLLSRFLPAARRGAILITTRHQALGTLAQGIHLLPMTLEEGMLFVLRRAKVLSASASGEQMQHLTENLPTEYNAAQELATVMDGFPLALDQAGAYIEETGCSLFDYGQRYEQRRSQLLDRRGIPAGDHPQSVVTTLMLAYQRVAQNNPVALELLCCCAFVASDATIPKDTDFFPPSSHSGSPSREDE